MSRVSLPNIYSSCIDHVTNTDSAPPHLDSQPAGNLPSLSLFTNTEFLGGDSPNLDTQFVFPRHRLEPMCISEASAKEAECLAVASWHADDFAKAEQAYLDAISQYSYLLGCDNLLLCQLRSNLADTQAHLHRLDESISTRRQIIAACWLQYGENAHETLHYTESWQEFLRSRNRTRKPTSCITRQPMGTKKLVVPRYN